MSENLKHRMVGFAMLCLGAVLGWYFVLGPLHAAQAGAAEVRYSLKIFLLVPMCAVFGAAWLIFGAGLDYRDAERQTLKPLGWVLIAITAALCALGFWWFKSQFAALGYN